MRPVRLAFACVLVVACGGGSEAAKPVKAAPTPSASAASTSLPTPAYTLRRSTVKEALKTPGVLFQYVVLDTHPVFLAGKFHGFRVAELRGGPEEWSGIDLKPGDVVTSVNGFPIERPEQALEAFQSLSVASELRVDLEREGEPRSLRWAIVDD
jgi:type II secretory pathway component PulC